MTGGLRDTRLSPLAWAVLPPLLFIPLSATLFAAPRFFDRYMLHVAGLVENLQALVLLGCVVSCLRLAGGAKSRARVGWLGAAALFTFILGEEINWGQVYLGFATPEPLARVNKQGDFNLHSVRGLPDLLGGLGMAVSSVVVMLGVAIPGLSRRAREAGARLLGPLLPERALLPAAGVLLLAQHVYIHASLTYPEGDHLHVWAAHELMELQLYLVPALYLHMKLAARTGA